MTADKTNGSGTHADWNLNVVGQPGAGDLTAANNLSDVANAALALGNLKGVSYGSIQALTEGEKTQARVNISAAPFDAIAYNGMQVNGSMEVSQERGTTLATAINNTYIVDGFAVVRSGTVTGVINAQQVADAPPGYVTSLKITVTVAQPSMASSDFVFIRQPVEGYRISRLDFGKSSASPMSIGFWVKTHRPGSYSGSIRATRSYAFSFTVNVADTWEYKAITIPGDTSGTWATDNSLGLELDFTMAVGTGLAGTPGVWSASNLIGATGSTNGMAATTDTFQITGVIVLPGIELPTASRAPFIMRPYDQELQLCRRYYERIGMTIVPANPPYNNTSWFRATKRVSPTLSLAQGNPLGGTIVVLPFSPLDGVRQLTSAAGAADTEWIADARM